jgi:hypothetical protein
VAAPDELGDRPAHRVADHDRVLDPLPPQERRDVVGAVVELEAPAADAARVAAQIGCDHAIAAAQRLERLEPVQPSARDPAVQEHDRGHLARPARGSHEHAPALGQIGEVPRRRRAPADELYEVGESS